MTRIMSLFVVLAPAIATAMLGFVVVVVPMIRAKLQAMMQSSSDVEWIKELVMHSAFYGTVVSAVLGFKKDAHETAILAGVWFVTLLYISRLLSKRLEELEDVESRDVHRKNAGMTRSVVRGEMDKATQRRKGDWVD